MGDGANNGLLPLLAGGKLHFYDGTQPAGPDTAITTQNDFTASTPLTLPSPAGTQANGVLTYGTVVDGVWSEDGVPTWFRQFKSDGTTALIDGTVGCYAIWVAAHAYSLGDWIVPTTSNGHYYECTTAGTSGASQPEWPTNGTTVGDGAGALVWTDRGTQPFDMMLGVPAAVSGVPVELNSMTLTLPAAA